MADWISFTVTVVLFIFLLTLCCFAKKCEQNARIHTMVRGRTTRNRSQNRLLNSIIQVIEANSSQEAHHQTIIVDDLQIPVKKKILYTSKCRSCVQLEKQKEICVICQDHIMNVYLEPCKHRMCLFCVRRLVRCPFCRVFIEEVRCGNQNIL